MMDNFSFRFARFKRNFNINKIQLALGLLNLLYFSVGVFAGRLWFNWAAMFLFLDVIIIFALAEYHQELRK